MKSLIVEDDFICGRVLQSFLNEYGEADIAVNGVEALAAYSLARDKNEQYDLICLDIMMPELDGQEVLKVIRESEEQEGVRSTQGVKIIMTTSLKDMSVMANSFSNLCDEYLHKPIDKSMLTEKLKGLSLI